MPSTIEYIRYDIDETATADDFEAAYAQAAEPLAASEHCLSFELARCVEEPNRYILRIEWDSFEGHMEEFRSSSEFQAFFAHIQPYVGSIDEMQRYDRTTVIGMGAGAGGDAAAAAEVAAPEAQTEPTLYEWAGGEQALRRMIDAFYDEVEQRDLFDNLFPGGVTEQHRHQVTAWWAEVFGGPSTYTDDFGGYDNMLNHHRNLNITDEQRSAFVALMSVAADKAELPADPEFRSALLAYLEWGTRLAFENAQPGAAPFEGATVPRWGWGVAPPYQP